MVLNISVLIWRVCCQKQGGTLMAKSHPEIRTGETFLGNFTEAQARATGWKTGRLGVVAFGEDDKQIATEPLRPFFVSKKELTQTP